MIRAYKILIFLLLYVTVFVQLYAGVVTFKESDGRIVNIPQNPKRVVIAYGSLVGVWYLSGGDAVGVPSVLSTDTLPEAARNLECIGTVNQPNPERILMLKPDLVLLFKSNGAHKRLRPLLERNGIETLAVEYENYSDFTRLLELFSRINGSDRNSASHEGSRIEKEVKGITGNILPGKGPRFLCLFASPKSCRVETSLTNTANMAEMLGGVNVIKASSTKHHGRVDITLEHLVMSDPDVIFWVSMGKKEKVLEKMKKELMSADVWKQLRAVKNGRVHFLASDLFLYRPNERYPEAFRKLKNLMYPVKTEAIK